MAVELTSKNEDVNKVHLFTIDGKEYFVEGKARVNVSLRYMNLVANGNEEKAMDYLFSKMLGTEAYEALMDYDGLTEEDMKAIVDALQKVATGESLDPNA